MPDPVDALTDRLIASERLIETLRAELRTREATVLRMEADHARLREAMHYSIGFLSAGGPESIAACDGGAWDASETLRAALDAVPRRAGTGPHINPDCGFCQDPRCTEHLMQCTATDPHTRERHTRGKPYGSRPTPAASPESTAP